MFLNFHDAVMHDEPIVATVRQSFENMLVVVQALDSAAEGRQVDVVAAGVTPGTGGVPLWRPRGARGLFDGLACAIRRIPSAPA